MRQAHWAGGGSLAANGQRTRWAVKEATPCGRAMWGSVGGGCGLVAAWASPASSACVRHQAQGACVSAPCGSSLFALKLVASAPSASTPLAIARTVCTSRSASRKCRASCSGTPANALNNAISRSRVWKCRAEMVRRNIRGCESYSSAAAGRAPCGV